MQRTKEEREVRERDEAVIARNKGLFKIPQNSVRFKRNESIIRGDDTFYSTLATLPDPQVSNRGYNSLERFNLPKDFV